VKSQTIQNSEIPKIPKIPENPGISGKSGNFENVGENFRDFGKTFSEFRNFKTLELFGKFRVFYKTALRSSVHIIKISVNWSKLCFSKKNPKMSRRLRKSPNPGKVRFSGFQDDAKIQPILENPGKNFRENRTFSEENFPKIENPENSEIGKFRKKVPKRRFWKIQPSFAERVLKRTF
jgi:hypothetical protein